jgi:hypothetical protein
VILATDPEARRLLEAVADIAFIAGANHYHSGDSRQDTDLFIKGAFEFEKKRKVDEKRNETYDGEDYMTAIERFAYDLLELEPLWGQQPPATGNATPTLIGDGETQKEKINMEETASKWTRFMDMNSGGGQKEKWSIILIEAPENEARVIFYNRFGHNPERVTCTCCGEDYSITEGDSLEQLTAYERGCRYAYVHKETGVVAPHGFVPTEGAVEQYTRKYVEGSEHGTSRRYLTLEEYLKDEKVLVVRASEIPPDQRQGDVPAQGYVWAE